MSELFELVANVFLYIAGAFSHVCRAVPVKTPCCCWLPLETKQYKEKRLLFPLWFGLCTLNPSAHRMWPVVSYLSLIYSFPAFPRMHTARSPSSIPTGVSGDALDLSLSGSQLSMSKRPSSASPGKYFSRSVSVSVASESRGKRNTLVSTCQLSASVLEHCV